MSNEDLRKSIMEEEKEDDEISITEKRVVAIVACSNAIEIQPIDNEDDCLATIMNKDGNDLTDRETEIADHMVDLWNENIDLVDVTGIEDDEEDEDDTSKQDDTYSPDE